jgi:hypothetical protein
LSGEACGQGNGAVETKDGLSAKREIHGAAKKGDVAAISAALDAGANINEFDGIATPLHSSTAGRGEPT